MKHEPERKPINIRNFLVVVFVVYGITYMIFSITLPEAQKRKHEQDRQDIIENKVKQHEKTLPHYKEYLQTKQQIAHYRDSLQRAMR